MSFAKVSEVKEGSLIKIDSGFSCASHKKLHRVLENDDGLFFPCNRGRHYLSGQISDDELHYVGIYLVKP